MARKPTKSAETETAPVLMPPVSAETIHAANIVAHDLASRAVPVSADAVDSMLGVVTFPVLRLTGPAVAPAETTPEAYTLAIAGQSPSLIAAVIQAEQLSKAAGVTIHILDAAGQPVRTITPPARGGRGGTVSAGPRGADWQSKSGQAIKLMMATDSTGATVGATMDEMRAITGWTFGQKYVDQLARSFGVRIWTVDATARMKRTWHAAYVNSAPAEAETEAEPTHDVDAAAMLDAAE